MRSARAKVVNGKIVTRAKFSEGTKLLLVVDEPQPEIDLDDEDQKALDEAIAATREGKLIPLETVRALLRTF
jgi:ABC-type protease/lipase transport system fused ATPase/permease subunit